MLQDFNSFLYTLTKHKQNKQLHLKFCKIKVLQKRVTEQDLRKETK